LKIFVFNVLKKKNIYNFLKFFEIEILLTKS
jgi:hypothetical protein